MQVCCSESRTHSPVPFATPFFEIIMVYYRLFLCSWIAPSTDILIVSSRNDFVFVLTVIVYCCNACDVHLFFVPPPDIFFSLPRAPVRLRPDKSVGVSLTQCVIHFPILLSCSSSSSFVAPLISCCHSSPILAVAAYSSFPASPPPSPSASGCGICS